MSHITTIKDKVKNIKALLWVLSLFLLRANPISAQCTNVPQENVIINGDFEAGYIASGPGSFTTDQMYVYDPANAVNSARMDAVLADPMQVACGGCNLPCAWNSDGRYHIASYFGAFRCDGGNYNGHPFLSETDGRYDHTQGVGGTGKYMMIDSKNGAATGLGIKFWEQTVNVIANQQYYFSAWFMNFSPNSLGANKVNLRFVVEAFDAGNVSLGVTQLGAQFSPADASRGNNWEQAFRTWNAPLTAVTARIGIYNQTANVLIGNDVAIDDISFTNGCQDIAGSATPPAPNLGPDINICTTNGNITLTSSVATNAGAGRVFSWYSGTGNPQTPLVTNSTTANTYAITTPGSYRVCVYEPGGCAKSSTIVISESNALSLGPDVSICNPTNAYVTLTGALTNTHASYTYSWLRNGSPIAGTTTSINATSTGTYTLTATHPTRTACTVNDVIVVNNTNSMTTNIGADANLCAGTATFTSSLTGPVFTYQWLRDGVAIPGATTSSYTASIAGVYTLNLIHPISGCNVTDNASVTNSNPITPNHGSFCAPPAAAVNLSVTGSGTFNWYAAASGGAALATNSTTYTTPAISATTTYYVEDMTSATGTALPGAAAYGTQDYNYNQTMKGMEFTTLKNNVTLNTVDFWVGTYSTVTNLTICLQNSVGGAIASAGPFTLGPTSATALKYTVNLNFSIPVMGTYRLILCGGTGGSLQGQTAPTNVTDATNTITFTQGLTQNNWESKMNYFQNVTFNAGANSCSRLPVTAYMTGPCPAPVDLISFDATASGSQVLLHWATAAEVNSSHFVVMRSADGINFQAIGSVASIGNSNSIHHYHFTDSSPLNGTSYYKLQQVDIDGTSMYSPTRDVNFGSGINIQVFPNPFSGGAILQLTGDASGVYSYYIFDVAGKLITYGSGENGVSQTIGEALAKGVYILEVKTSGSSKSMKLVKE